jgi:cell wall-associated NlpC family hydrolase
MSHWAASLVGKPWEPAATGPHAFDCRGLVRHVYRTRLGREVTALAPELALDAKAVIEAAHRDGLRKVVGLPAPREYDIAVMAGGEGPHVGTFVADGARLLLLHSPSQRGADGVVRGASVAEPLDIALRRGYARPHLWRLDEAAP